MMRHFAVMLAVVCGLWGARIAWAAEAGGAMPNQKDMLMANVREFGAKGDGKIDDTVAIEKAWAFVMDTQKPQHNGGGATAVNTTLYFPPGAYRYTGKGLESGVNGAQCWQVKGDGVNSARIEIESDVYFITCGRVHSTAIEGLSFIGGKGVFKSTYTGNMVGGNHVFRDCYFFDYTECAIGNNADDSPYLMVDGCIFHCRDKAEAIGIAWGGDIADSHIMRSHFEQNAYHIKLGDLLGNAFQVGPRNLFLSWGATHTKADIWIVPKATGPMNSGQGAIIAENKFGNENIDTARPRVLLASENKASGIDRISRKPSEEISAKNEFITGIRLRDNVIAGGGAPERGVVYSRVPNTAMVFDHNQFFGSQYPYLIEFDSRIQRLPDNAGTNRTYVYSQEFYEGRLCNLPGYAVVQDTKGEFAGAGESLAGGSQCDDPSYTPFVSLAGKDMAVTGQGSVQPARDPRGNMTAAAVRLEDAVSGLDIKFDNAASLVEGRMAYLDVELKASKLNPLDHIKVMVLNNNAGRSSAGKITNEQNVISRTVRLQPYWQRVTIPFVIRDTRGGDFHLAIRQPGWDPNEVVKGSKDGFECGNVRVYHARSPMGVNLDGVRIAKDQDVTLSAGVDPEQVIYDGTLTAPRTVKFSAASPSIRPLPGSKFRISRPASGDSPLKIEGASDLAAGEWCDLIYTGDKFCLVARGKLQ